MFEKQPSIYVAYCIVVDSIYIHYTLYFYHMGLNNLFMRHISLCVIIVGQIPPSKIAIVNQPCFIFTILQGNYTYFEGLSNKIWIEENFTTLQLEIITE